MLSLRWVLAPVVLLAGERADVIRLPEPRRESNVSLERCLATRRSVRAYRDAPLTLAEVGQLLWAAQGITAAGGLRTVPSAGALYPLEVYVAAGKTEGLAPGIYRYQPEGHRLVPVAAGDKRKELAAAALDQECVRDGAAVIVLAAVHRRTMKKYGERAVRYVHIEVGHAAQNLCLQATALGLGAVTVGAFRDAEVKRIARMEAEEEPLYILPVGRR